MSSVCCVGILKLNRLERPDFGDDLEKEGQNSGSKTGLAINRPPFVFIIAARQVIEEFLFFEVQTSFTITSLTG